VCFQKIPQKKSGSKKVKKRLLTVSVILIVMFLGMVMLLAVTVGNKAYRSVSLSQYYYTVTVGEKYGKIYDCYFRPLTGSSMGKRAVFPADEENPYPYVADVPDYFQPKDGEILFNLPRKLSENQLATHVVGYDIEGEGITGLLAGYNSFLNSLTEKVTVTYSVDGFGDVLEGVEPEINEPEDVKGGVVSTIDRDIQEICETVAEEYKKNMEKGAIVVMDVNTGEIRAMVSVPDYSPLDISSALSAVNSPLLNRAEMAFNVGSCFKLLISAEAFNQGLEDFTYDCQGVVDVEGVYIHCHNLAGHGEQNLEDAIRNSCNPYFISLSQQLDQERLLDFAKAMGFGEADLLANGEYTASGNLPTNSDLEIPAESANFAFGQGKLTATPIQVCTMTAIIANGGIKVEPTLFRGITLDGKTLEKAEGGIEIADRVISAETSERLKYYMKAAVYKNPLSNARTVNTVMSAKTSTAQTGRYDENNSQIYNAWVTGFFPSLSPQYAITVLCEDGGYGNTVASPVLKAIAERVSGLRPDN
jgi:penicillin-binding protein 2